MSDKLENIYTKEFIRTAALDVDLIELRRECAQLTAKVFGISGEALHVGGHIIGSDRSYEESPFGHGSDETVAVSLLLRIGSQLVSASNDLFSDGRHYAAAALLRQLVEIEYLAWAFETRDEDAKTWLRSTKSERMQFFSPKKLRDVSDGRFRGKDYGYHCELGGHPVPNSGILLSKDKAYAQLLLSDLLGHTSRIWGHVATWANDNSYSEILHNQHNQMTEKYSEWKKRDPLVDLPPPQ